MGLSHSYATTSADMRPSSTRLRRKRSACAVSREPRLTPPARVPRHRSTQGTRSGSTPWSPHPAILPASRSDTSARSGRERERPFGALPRCAAALARRRPGRGGGTSIRRHRQTPRRRTFARCSGSRPPEHRGSRAPARLTHSLSRSSSAYRNPAAANSAAQTESSTARSGACPSATACVRVWWSDGRATVTTSTSTSGGAPSRIIRAQGPSSGTTIRSRVDPVGDAASAG